MRRRGRCEALPSPALAVLCCIPPAPPACQACCLARLRASAHALEDLEGCGVDKLREVLSQLTPVVAAAFTPLFSAALPDVTNGTGCGNADTLPGGGGGGSGSRRLLPAVAWTTWGVQWRRQQQQRSCTNPKCSRQVAAQEIRPECRSSGSSRHLALLCRCNMQLCSLVSPSQPRLPPP